MSTQSTTIPRGRIIDSTLQPLRLGNPLTFPFRWYGRRYLTEEGRRFMVIYHIIFIYMVGSYYLREHEHLSIFKKQSQLTLPIGKLKQENGAENK